VTLGIGKTLRIVGQSARAVVAHKLRTVFCLISVALGITNLLPIPGLDGGRILFVVIEIIRGKPMRPEREGLIHLIGVMLLLGLIFLTVLNDIFNPINIDSIR